MDSFQKESSARASPSPEARKFQQVLHKLKASAERDKINVMFGRKVDFKSMRQAVEELPKLKAHSLRKMQAVEKS
jgi:hypothetical protein